VSDNTAKIPWKFLSDNAVRTDEQDKFGVHSAYAKVLYHIAKTCDTPFSIALYSSWGTGKTSICNLIQNLAAKDTNVHYVYLDVWKYSNEPLKRWILIETCNSLTAQGAISKYELDLTGPFCTSRREGEFTRRTAGYANQEVQSGTDRDVAAAD
jgi:KAP family P-loop domain